MFIKNYLKVLLEVLLLFSSGLFELGVGTVVRSEVGLIIGGVRNIGGENLQIKKKFMNRVGKERDNVDKRERSLG